MDRLSPIRIQKGFEVLADRLAEQILTGVIKHGELLPNERDLGEISGLSRGSVREALRVLEAQGLVSTKRGRNGGRVAVPAGGQSFRRSVEFFIRGQRIPLSVLLETVEVLEPNLAQLAARHRDEQDLADLRVAHEKLAATTTPGRFANANARWHEVMARASHNPLLIAVYESLGAAEFLKPRIAGFISDDIRAAVLHAVEQVERAIVAGDAEAARRRMERHVRAYRASLEAAAPERRNGARSTAGR